MCQIFCVRSYSKVSLRMNRTKWIQRTSSFNSSFVRKKIFYSKNIQYVYNFYGTDMYVNVYRGVLEHLVCVSGGKKCSFSEYFACFVFLKHPSWDSPFCLITDDLPQSRYLRSVLRSKMVQQFLSGIPRIKSRWFLFIRSRKSSLPFNLCTTY